MEDYGFPEDCWCLLFLKSSLRAPVTTASCGIVEKRARKVAQPEAPPALGVNGQDTGQPMISL